MKAFYIFSLIVILNLGLFAQECTFESISTKQGLSQNDVNCILQDKQGFMWFGTLDGLNRYDGYGFNSYHFNVDGKIGLNSNLIRSVAEDTFQNIWVGTSDRGLNVITHKTNAIENITIPNSQNNLLEKESIIAIEFIGKIAIVLSKEKIYFFRFSENEIQPIKINDEYFAKTGAFATKCFYQINESEFFLGTTNGLKRVSFTDKEVFDVKIKTYKNKLNINEIIPFRRGYILACAGTMHYIDENFKFDLFDYQSFTCLLKADENHLWAGNFSGLHYLAFDNPHSPKYKIVKSYTKENTNGGLQSNNVISIFKDKLGIMWLGTSGGGVSKMINGANKFKLYREKIEDENLKDKKINCFFEDSETKLWIGTENGEIAYFNRTNSNYNKKAVNIPTNHKTTRLILAINELNTTNDSVIIISTGYPLNIRVLSLQGEELDQSILANKLRLISHPVNTMVNDNQFLWLGTQEGGLYRYNLKSNDLDRFLKNHTCNLNTNLIRSLCNDNQNRLWIGTDKGLYRLSSENKSKSNLNFEIFVNNPNDKNSISYNYILPIIQTKDDNIWIGTMGGGLNRYIKETNSFERFTTKNGLSNNNIKGIIEDDENRLWVSSNQGLICYNPADNRFLNFSVSDGLQDMEFREMAYLKRKSGELLFGGNNGFNSFFPGKIQIDSTMPDIVFTELQIKSITGKSDKVFNSGRLNEISNSDEIIQLKFHQNSFTSNFTALHFFAPQKIKYKYRLLGFEEQWNEISTHSRFAKYTNLNPGEYRLEVLATNSDGIWSKTPLSLNFKIRKPWYGTGLAYAIYGIILITIFLFFNRYSLIRNKIKHELLMERFEKEKEKELTQIKLRFFTNISHELRTPLTIIKSYFENIVPNWQSLPKEKLSNDLGVITRNVDSLLRLVNQILDFRKLEQDKMKLTPEKRDIIKLIESATKSINIIASHKNINLQFIHDKQELELWFDRDKMDKILNNILTNAIKYTNRNGNVTVRVNELPNEVRIEVEDDGIGIPKNIQASIFERFYQADSQPVNSMESTGIGLSLTKGLVDLHQGRIELNSTEGQGSIFILYIKKGNDHFNKEDLIHETKSNKLPLFLTDNTPEQAFELNKNDQPIHSEKLILVVEDNEDLCNFLKEKLKHSFKVETAPNGKVGIEKCLEKIPDLVLSDIMMPEMDGYELCHTLKSDEKISHIPVILLTAKSNSESELHGYKLGADAYVSKPFDIDVLIAQINSTINSREKIWKKLKENPFTTPAELTFTKQDEDFLTKITSIIEEHISNSEFTVEQLAEQYGINQINLNKKIKSLTGKTTIQFIRFNRLKRAAQLLQLSQSRVSEVTYDVGYSDLQHFRQHFKKEFALSPSEYKKKYAQE